MPSRILVFSSGDQVHSGKFTYSVSYTDATSGSTVTLNILADGDDNGKPYKLNGSTHVYIKDPNGNDYTGATRVTGSRCLVASSSTNGWCVPPEPPPPHVELPAYTMRFRFSDTNYDPTTATLPSGFSFKSGCTWTQVTGTGYNDWDYTRADSNWNDEFNGIFTDPNNMVDIIAAGDMSGVTSMKNVKYKSNKVNGGTFGSGDNQKACSIRSICSFDSSNITNIDGLCFHCIYMKKAPEIDMSHVTSTWSTFDSCTSMAYVNRLDLSSATYVRSLFANCNLKQLPSLASLPSRITNCQYMFQGNNDCGINGNPGITAAYNELAARSPSSTTACFKECGKNTTAGNAELRNIPSGWK